MWITLKSFDILFALSILNYSDFITAVLIVGAEFLILSMVKILSGKPVRQSLYFQVFFWVALFLLVTARNYGEHENPDFREMIIYDFCHWIFQIIGANFIYYILV